MMSSYANIKELKRLLQEANLTMPWKQHKTTVRMSMQSDDCITTQREEDAAYIAAACMVVPVLIQEIEDLRSLQNLDYWVSAREELLKDEVCLNHYIRHSLGTWCGLETNFSGTDFLNQVTCLDCLKAHIRYENDWKKYASK